MKQFFQNECGAVTTDWIVLTPAICGLSIAAVMSIRGGVETLGGNIETSLTLASVTGLGDLQGAGGQTVNGADGGDQNCIGVTCDWDHLPEQPPTGQQ